MNQSFEANHPHFQLPELLRAQSKSWEALKKIADQIKVGMTEGAAIELAKRVIQESGATKSWHRPIVRFGEGTNQQFKGPHDLDRVLKDDDLFFIDIGPVYLGNDGFEYEGDVGDTFVVGENKTFKECAEAVRQLFRSTVDHWKELKTTGVEIYRALEEAGKKTQFIPIIEVDGHRIGSFPHHPFFKGPLAEITFHPKGGAWILEVHLVDPSQKFGAFFEDLLI